MNTSVTSSLRFASLAARFRGLLRSRLAHLLDPTRGEGLEHQIQAHVVPLLLRPVLVERALNVSLVIFVKFFDHLLVNVVLGTVGCERLSVDGVGESSDWQPPAPRGVVHEELLGVSPPNNLLKILV